MPNHSTTILQINIDTTLSIIPSFRNTNKSYLMLAPFDGKFFDAYSSSVPLGSAPVGRDILQFLKNISLTSQTRSKRSKAKCNLVPTFRPRSPGPGGSALCAPVFNWSGVYHYTGNCTTDIFHASEKMFATIKNLEGLYKITENFSLIQLFTLFLSLSKYCLTSNI